MTTKSTPAQRTANAQAQQSAKPLLELVFEATKETAGTVRYDMTDESVKANGERGTNIYIPKSMIKTVPGGLRPTIKILIFGIEE